MGNLRILQRDMLNDPTPETSSGPRNFLLLSAVALLFGGVYVGWVFYSRWEANHALAEKAAEKQRTQNQEAFEAMGGNRFDILAYSADPDEIKAGEKSSLCYSVSNSKSVKIEPPPEEPTWPAFSRCVHVSPRKTTTYTMTVDDGAGHSKTASVEIRVR
ncbi:MAG TPA: hypothetical protein VNZ63_11370 [Verrucomicrobiae bacterium]|nr:hypothetical protein [Verrucomicrobiae bacterium]